MIKTLFPWTVCWPLVSLIEKWVDLLGLGLSSMLKWKGSLYFYMIFLRNIWERNPQWLEMRTNLVSIQSSQQASGGTMEKSSTVEDKNQNLWKHFHQSLWADVAWVTPCFHSTPGLCVVQGVRNLTMRGNGVWSLWQTIGQKWRLKCLPLSLVHW